MTMKDDLANRSTDIHWPPGFDPVKADLFSHNELFINASCERVWQHIIEAPKWPQWYPNSKDVRIVSDASSVLKDGIAFRWTTFGLPLESKIHEFVPYTRIGWYGLSDLLVKGPLHVDELASRTKTNASALFRLLRALESVGIFARVTNLGVCHVDH